MPSTPRRSTDRPTLAEPRQELTKEQEREGSPERQPQPQHTPHQPIPMPGSERSADRVHPSPVPARDHGRPTRLLDHDRAEEFRARWHELQLNFVDDPTASVVRARDLLDREAALLQETVERRRRELHRAAELAVSTDRPAGPDGPDGPDGQDGRDSAKIHHDHTEQLRLALCEYRVLVEHLLEF